MSECLKKRWQAVDRGFRNTQGHVVKGPSIYTEDSVEEVVGCSEWMRVDPGVFEYIVELHNANLEKTEEERTPSR